jgi:hypothetical protein
MGRISNQLEQQPALRIQFIWKTTMASTAHDAPDNNNTLWQQLCDRHCWGASSAQQAGQHMGNSDLGKPLLAQNRRITTPKAAAH